MAEQFHWVVPRLKKIRGIAAVCAAPRGRGDHQADRVKPEEAFHVITGLPARLFLAIYLKYGWHWVPSINVSVALNYLPMHYVVYVYKAFSIIIKANQSCQYPYATSQSGPAWTDQPARLVRLHYRRPVSVRILLEYLTCSLWRKYLAGTKMK